MDSENASILKPFVCAILSDIGQTAVKISEALDTSGIPVQAYVGPS